MCFIKQVIDASVVWNNIAISFLRIILNQCYLRHFLGPLTVAANDIDN
jgi:hypothetical protein